MQTRLQEIYRLTGVTSSISGFYLCSMNFDTMKKINLCRLSQKQIDKIKIRAAFSMFVQSLKFGRDDDGNFWTCCHSNFFSLKDLHKHVSCNHMGAIAKLGQKLFDESPEKKQEELRPLLYDFTLIDDHCCSCTSKKFIVVLFYQYVNLLVDLNSLKKWQVNLFVD